MKKYKVNEGDYFALSLSEMEEDILNFKEPYAFGRVVAILPSKKQIVEIFKYHGSITDDVEMLRESGRLFSPVSVAAALHNGRWKVIKSDPSYTRKDADFDNIKLAMTAGQPRHMWQLWQGGVTRKASPEELEGVEDFIIYLPVQLEARIRKELKILENDPHKN
jgi:hypothetical protein